MRDANRKPTDLLVDDLLRARPVDANRLLAALADRPPVEVCALLAARLHGVAAATWERGWLPADLVHSLNRTLDKPSRRIASLAVVDAATPLEGDAMPAVWRQQLAKLRAEVGRQSLDNHLRGAGPPGSAGWRTVVMAARNVHIHVSFFQEIPTFVPPPSRWSRDAATAGDGLDEAVLDKIRALLAKAESTTFEQEAMAFTAKAQELMARYSLDPAMLGTGDRSATTGRRIRIDDPYAKGKFVLLSGIARANRCATVWLQGHGLADVFGDPVDLEIVDLLYTSLLVQATSAMLAAGRDDPASRTKSFRHAFLLSYAARIAERLAEVNRSTASSLGAEDGIDLLPVLASRERAARDAASEAHPKTEALRASATNVHGINAGRSAANLADVSVSPRVGRRTRGELHR